MPKTDFKLEFIKDQNRLSKLSGTLLSTPFFAVDIETVEWWNRRRERVALVQIAFRDREQPKVVLIDALSRLDFEVLRQSFEHPQIVKIMHNASFDATRLAKHYNLAAAPVHDTMAAARRSGERKYSLTAQAAIHLQIRLDKSVQTTDWSRRPLDARQLSYAALDAYATLLLYENQAARNLPGGYQLKSSSDESVQVSLPLDGSPPLQPVKTIPLSPNEIDSTGAALLGIVAQLPDRYSPAQLAASLGSDRIGLAGWIVDSRLGRDIELDEETVKMKIADLCDRRLLRMTETRRLEATKTGTGTWERLK